MDRGSIRQLSELADVIVVLGTDHPAVRELLERLEAGELSLREATAVLRRVESGSARTIH